MTYIDRKVVTLVTVATNGSFGMVAWPGNTIYRRNSKFSSSSQEVPEGIATTESQSSIRLSEVGDKYIPKGIGNYTTACQSSARQAHWTH